MTELLPDRPLTPRELAHRWQISPRQVRKLAAAGELSCFRVGKGYRFPLESVRVYEAGGCGQRSIEGHGTPSGPKADEPTVRSSTPRIVLLPNKGPRTI